MYVNGMVRGDFFTSSQQSSRRHTAVKKHTSFLLLSEGESGLLTEDVESMNDFTHQSWQSVSIESRIVNSPGLDLPDEDER